MDLVVARITLVWCSDLIVIKKDLVNLGTFGTVLGDGIGEPILTVQAIVQQVIVGRMCPIAGTAFEIFPSDLQLRGLRVVRKALQGALVVFLDVLGTRIPTVRACLALGVLNADLVGGPEFGTGVVPRPPIGLLAEETL